MSVQVPPIKKSKVDEDSAFPWSQHTALELSELKDRLKATETGRYLLLQLGSTDEDKVVLAKLLYAMETGCYVRTDGMYYCGHFCHMDGLGNVYMRFHPDGFAAMVKPYDFEADPNVIYNETLARTQGEDDGGIGNYQVHKFNYTCKLVTPDDVRYNESLFEILFTPINRAASRHHEMYGAHPNGYINMTDGQLSHRYTGHNWTHTRKYQFAELVKWTTKKEDDNTDKQEEGRK